MKTVAGVFAAETQAVRALEDLHSADIDPHSVSVIARSREEAREVAGGLIGALTGWGFSERQAHEYQDRIEHGELLLAVDVPDDRDTGRVEDILRRDGGDMVSTGSPRR